ncbi:MAG: alpha/beta hydrolase [Saprospiraceae bacterium]
MRLTLLLLISLTVFSCQKESFDTGTDTDNFFFLRNDGADMPVWVQGNTASKTFVLLLHGGPGGSAFLIDEFFLEFTDPLEASYGVVYWEQRSSGSSQGNFDLETLTPEKYVEDLEKLIILLKNKYGTDINVFLTGISWGGYLGSAYLSKINNQDEVKAWISIVGTNSFSKIANLGKQKLLFYANQQIAIGKNVSDWTEIRDWAEQQDTILSKEDFVEENSFAAKAEVLMEDSLNNSIEMASLGQQLSFVFSSPFSSNAWLSNRKGIQESNLLDIVLKQDVSVDEIMVPSLFIGGEFDFIVPKEVVMDQYNAVQTAEKELHILPNSGHNIIGQEVEKLSRILSDFIEKYK